MGGDVHTSFLLAWAAVGLSLAACCSLLQAGVEVASFKLHLYNAFIVSQLFRRLSYPLLAPGGALCTSPGCGASFSLRRLLHSLPLIFWPWCTVLPCLRTLGPFDRISISTILELEPFTSIPSPYKWGREEQDLHAQGCNSESLHIHAASQDAMPRPSLLLIISVPMASPRNTGKPGEALFIWRRLWCYALGQSKCLATGFRTRFCLPTAVGHCQWMRQSEN